MKGDTAATAFVVTDYLYLSDVTGAVLDSTWVPVKRRNGAHPDLLRRFSKNPTDQELGEEAIYGSSVPMDLHWLPGERIALVSTDWNMVRERFVDSSFVSVVDPRARRACVDAQVPGPTDPPVSIAFRGDTLFVVAQEVTGDTRASTVVRWYRIDTGACRWLRE